MAAVGTTGQMLWGAAFDFGTSSAGYLLRQTLTPVHDYWTSAKRVQAAVEEEQAALDPAVPPSVDDEGVIMNSKNVTYCCLPHYFQYRFHTAC